MIIDFEQNKDGVEISFVNDDNQIEIIKAPLAYGYYKYVRADSFDTNTITGVKSFKHGDLIKREQADRFSNHNINEYLNYELKHTAPKIHERITKLNLPNPFSVDIETEITDEYGYSSAELAQNKILSISMTNVDMKTIVFMLENPEHPTINDIDKLYIDSIIQDTVKEYYDDFKYEIVMFKSETEMLERFLTLINTMLHSMFGWNFPTYDWQYIVNRCERLGLDIRKASPTFKATQKSFTVKKGKSSETAKVSVKVPNHRVIADYMMMFKTSMTHNNLGSYSLDNIAEIVLGLKKVTYKGNLRSLYKNDFRKFTAYAICDTILVMLIHHKINFYAVDFFESYFNGMAYNKISQNAISEALVYNELRNGNLFLLESEFNITEKESYEGGYVKNPLRKLMRAGMGFDFSGLYPNSIITIGISPERIVDKIKVNRFGIPINDEEMEKWKMYRAQNCSLSPLGTVYSLEGGDGLYVRIEKKLIKQRKVFKGHAGDIYVNIMERIDNRIAELEAV